MRLFSAGRKKITPRVGVILVGSADEFRIRSFRCIRRASLAAHYSRCASPGGLWTGRRRRHHDPARRRWRRRSPAHLRREATPSPRRCWAPSTPRQIAGLPPTVLGVCGSAVDRPTSEDPSSFEQVRLRGIVYKCTYIQYTFCHGRHQDF